MEGFSLNDTDWIKELKKQRTQYGVSQNQLAVMAGVSREYISRLESGKVTLTEEIKEKVTDALERLNPDNPLEMVLEKFSHYVFGIDYAVIMGILEQTKGSDTPCMK